MIIILIRAISWFARLITLALAARAILSWVGQDPYSGPGKAYRFMIKVTEPVVSPCRMLLQRFNFNTGMMDFSVLLAFFLVQIVRNLLIQVVSLFAF